MACYEESTDADPELSFWEVVAWFTTDRPIPIRTLQDVHHHGRRFALDQPSTPLVYLLTGHARAVDSVQAIAGVVGFLLHNRHVVTSFVVTETRATRRSAATPVRARQEPSDRCLAPRSPSFPMTSPTAKLDNMVVETARQAVNRAG
ncbi:hypothetical protein ACFQX6_48205 [Streptosporangium lutulentum]